MEARHEAALKDYLLGMKYKDIALKHGVSIDAVKKWKKVHWHNIVRDKKSVHKTSTRKAKSKCTPKAPVITNNDPGLNERQRLFCLYFINNRNATQAYLKAYGSSWAVANTEAYRLLANPRVKNEINRLREIKAQSIMFGPDDIVERYMRIAFADMADVADWGTEELPVLDDEGGEILSVDGTVRTYQRNFLNFKGSDCVDGGLIREISLGRAGMKVKLEDRQKALEWLSKWFDMNPMDKHRRAYDNAVLEIRKKELELKDF